MVDSKCKICRRLGVKLFLKSERCLSPKCPMINRPYAPGLKGKRRVKMLSEYGKELREKQKLKNWYNLKETQFRKYVKRILSLRTRSEDAAVLLIRLLENRLDNAIFRLGIAASRSQARQLVSHSHFLVNGKPVNIPSFSLKKGDVIEIKPKSLNKNIFQDISAKLKKQKIPSWLTQKDLKWEVTGEPLLEEVAPPVEISTIFEFYSR